MPLMMRIIPLSLSLSLLSLQPIFVSLSSIRIRKVSNAAPDHPAHYLCLKDGWLAGRPAGQQGVRDCRGGGGGGLGVKTDLPKEEGNWPREAAAGDDDSDSSRSGGSQQVEERWEEKEKKSVSASNARSRHAAPLFPAGAAPGNGLSARVRQWT